MVPDRWRRFAAAAAGRALLYGFFCRVRLRQAAANVRAFDLPSPGLYDALVATALGGLYARVATDVAAICPSGRILEVGSGPGRLAVLLSTAAPAAAVVGIDLSIEMVARADRRVAAAGVGDRVQFVVGDVAALPLGSAECDWMVSTLSLHHWPRPADALADVHRVLKPGGEAWIYDLAHWLWSPAADASRLLALASASPFGGWSVEAVHWPWRLPAFVRLCLVRSTEEQ